MEENKIDIYQIIGFLFLIAAFFWWFNVTIPELEQDALEENETISQIQNQDENKLFSCPPQRPMILLILDNIHQN